MQFVHIYQIKNKLNMLFNYLLWEKQNLSVLNVFIIRQLWIFVDKYFQKHDCDVSILVPNAQVVNCKLLQVLFTTWFFCLSFSLSLLQQRDINYQNGRRFPWCNTALHLHYVTQKRIVLLFYLDQKEKKAQRRGENVIACLL